MRLLYIQMAFYAALSSLFLIYGTCSQFTPANHSAPQAILYLAFTKRDDGESRSPPGGWRLTCLTRIPFWISPVNSLFCDAGKSKIRNQYSFFRNGLKSSILWFWLRRDLSKHYCSSWAWSETEQMGKWDWMLIIAYVLQLLYRMGLRSLNAAEVFA